MELTGTIDSIIYRNTENGYTVLELLQDDDSRLTVVGSLALCTRGERVVFTGQYLNHPKYGRQFKAETVRALAPATLGAIEAYLSSGLVKGVGPVMAKAIVRHFGMDTLPMLEKHPERLTEVSGIGKKKAEMIANSYRENTELRDITLALEPYGITVPQVLKLYKVYGNLTLARVQENPYQLIEDVDGIGFVTADKIAQNVEGFSVDSETRIRAGILHSLNLACREYGHTCLPKNSLISYAAKLLGVDEFTVDDVVNDMIGRSELVYRMVEDDDMIFLPSFARMEKYIAEKLCALSEPPEENPFLTLAAGQSHGGIALAEQQRNAVTAAVTNGVLVITGGPGTGKTTIIRYITEILTDMQMEFALCAPTGRAAKRMTEATDCEAKTLHRLLEYIPGTGFLRDEDNPLLYDMIIVDETSMVDVPLMYALLKAVPPGTRLVLVGDSDQLPPVGCGNVLRDIISSDTVPVVRLTEIFRQAQQSLIVLNAHRVNRGELPLFPEDAGDRPDFRFEEILSQEDVLRRVVRLCKEPENGLMTSEPLLDIQVLVPMKKGTLGVININTVLQAELNPPSPDKNEYNFGSVIFREGDKIMQMQNNYKISWTKRGSSGQLTEGTGVFNGDLGTVYRIDVSARSMTVLFDDDRLARYEFAEADSLGLAYCISIHKSQGSEFPVVILPLCGGTPLLLTRNLLYTAITRAKSQVFCLGRRETVKQMVSNNRDTRRYTSLCANLKNVFFEAQL